MRSALLCLFFIAGFAAEGRAQPNEQQCYYVADSDGDEATVTAAAAFLFPFRLGQAPTDHARAVTTAQERVFGSYLRSIGNAWRSERTPHGRRYLYANGLTVQLQGIDCESGEARVHAYLADLASLAPTSPMAVTLNDFRANTRQVPEAEFHWASPPLPVMLAPPQQPSGN